MTGRFATSIIRLVCCFYQFLFLFTCWSWQGFIYLNNGDKIFFSKTVEIPSCSNNCELYIWSFQVVKCIVLSHMWKELLHLRLIRMACICSREVTMEASDYGILRSESVCRLVHIDEKSIGDAHLSFSDIVFSVSKNTNLDVYLFRRSLRIGRSTTCLWCLLHSIRHDQWLAQLVQILWQKSIGCMPVTSDFRRLRYFEMSSWFCFAAVPS